MIRRSVLVVALMAAAAALSGCGRAGDRAQVRAVTDRFLAALQQGDGKGACDELSSDTRSQLQSQEGKPCPGAITGLGLHRATVTRVQVYITNAKADLADGESVFLEQGPSGWEVSAAGCKPTGGKPADLPYDCEVQS